MMLSELHRRCAVAYLAVATPEEVTGCISGLRKELDSPVVFLMGRGEWSQAGIESLANAIENGRPVIVACLEAPAEVPLLEALVAEINDVDHGSTYLAGRMLSIERSGRRPLLTVVHRCLHCGGLSLAIRGMLGYGFPQTLAASEHPLREYLPLTMDVDPGEGQTAARIVDSLKTLCLLHTRDASCEPRKLKVICKPKDGQVATWSDVQHLIGQPLGKGFAEQLLELDAINRDQYAAIKDGKRLIAQGLYEPNTQVYRSIFHAVWDLHYAWRLERAREHRLYRGHFKATWRLDSTLLRPDALGYLELEELLERVNRVSAFLSELRTNQHALLGTTDLSQADLVAVAQHFGYPTPLLDFTHSALVAAFFATHDFTKAGIVEGGEGIGSIVILRGEDDMRPSGEASNRARDVDAPLGEQIGLNLTDLLGVRLGRYREITPRLPTDENRIARQQGVFIAGADAGHLGERAEVHHFRQHPGQGFLDPIHKITETDLLPAGTPVAVLVARMKTQGPNASSSAAEPDVRAAQVRPTSTPLSSEIGRAVVTSRSLLGAHNALLRIQLEAGHRFFQKLSGELINPPEARLRLAEIIKEYVELCAGRVGKASSPYLAANAPRGPWETDLMRAGLELSGELVMTLVRLAEWAGVAPESLVNEVVGAYVACNRRAERAHSKPTRDVERVAMAVGLYLTAWERLRLLEGFVARDLAWDAERLLESS